LVDTDSFSPLEKQLFDELVDWDYRELAEMRTPTIYEEWWARLSHMIWDDEMRSPWGQLEPPRRDVTTQLILEEPQSQFFDDVRTVEEETLSDLVNTSFREIIVAIVDEVGEPSPLWRWGRYRGTDIKHLAALPALSHLGVPTGGSSATVAASSAVHGVSWRMIVELTDPPQAWGIYPGGQSGNPGSQFYDNQIDSWLSGDYYKLNFLTTLDGSLDSYSVSTIMRGGQ
ncbi:MAG: penicillin acylase family protein, partial [bacterium]